MKLTDRAVVHTAAPDRDSGGTNGQIVGGGVLDRVCSVLDKPCAAEIFWPAYEIGCRVLWEDE